MSIESLTILEPRISHPLRPEYAGHGQGVALLIYNSKGEILLGKEAQEDHDYKWNILTETWEPHERMKATVIRGLQEEPGREYSEFCIIPGSYRETTSIYIARLGYLYKYRCVCLKFLGSPAVQFKNISGEVTEYRWVSSNDLDTFEIEYGARLVINYYQSIFDTLHL